MKTLIIVESTNSGLDRNLIQKILEFNEFDFSRFDIRTTEDKKTKKSGNISDVLDYLRYQLYSDRGVTWKDIQNVLIIVDADENPESRLKEIVTALKRNDKKDNFNIPDKLNIINKEKPEKINVGIFLFPNCKDRGSIETLCVPALKHGKCAKKLKCLENYFKCLEKNKIDINEKTENNKAKSKFRVFIATPNPDRYVNSAIDCIDFSSGTFKEVIDFIRKTDEKSSS